MRESARVSLITGAVFLIFGAVIWLLPKWALLAGWGAIGIGCSYMAWRSDYYQGTPASTIENS